MILVDKIKTGAVEIGRPNTVSILNAKIFDKILVAAPLKYS